MKMWEVWLGEFSCVTSIHAAELIASVQAENFDDAVVEAFKGKDAGQYLEKHQNGDWHYIGLRIFDNREEADRNIENAPHGKYAVY